MCFSKGIYMADWIFMASMRIINITEMCDYLEIRLHSHSSSLSEISFFC